MIDLIYLNESKRIRKEYLQNLAFIVSREEEIESYMNEIKNIQSQIDKSENKKIELFTDQLRYIDVNIDKINKFISVYYDKIKQLDKDQKILYNNIKDKYPNINDDDIKNQIMKFIEPVNNEFVKNNEKLYKKILNNEN
jgi:hypothetical protein